MSLEITKSQEARRAAGALALVPVLDLSESGSDPDINTAHTFLNLIKMCRFTVIALSFLVFEQTVLSATVDQRQTGDLNVQIDLKNLQIVGLMKGKEDYVEYDYAYDYSEMTIKPSSGTTKKPLNVTEAALTDKDNTTAIPTVFAELDHTTSSIKNSSSTETEVTTALNAENNDITVINSTTPSSQDSIANTSSNSTTSMNCKKGFFRNSMGNCELKLQNPSNALLKMLKQKTKLNGNSSVRWP